uniref:Uncharacterized protein n=1 Tax=Anopheles dirus TaxID=7168 RepID=A0A182NG94_9DIPT
MLATVADQSEHEQAQSSAGQQLLHAPYRSQQLMVPNVRHEGGTIEQMDREWFIGPRIRQCHGCGGQFGRYAPIEGDRGGTRLSHQFVLAAELG